MSDDEGEFYGAEGGAAPIPGPQAYADTLTSRPVVVQPRKKEKTKFDDHMDHVERGIVQAIQRKAAFFDYPVTGDNSLDDAIASNIKFAFPDLEQYGPISRVRNVCCAVSRGRNINKCPPTQCHCEPSHIRVRLPMSMPGATEKRDLQPGFVGALPNTKVAAVVQ
jgi:hypothetical protein